MNYFNFECMAKKSFTGGRPMGGISVFVRQEFSTSFTRICDEFEFGVILRIDKDFFDISRDCVFCAVYFPPTGSPFYQENSETALKCLEETLIFNNLIGLNLILCGDLNSRTGRELDFIEHNYENIPELREFSELFENDVTLPRFSKDNIVHVNKCGKDLLKFCKTYGCFIVNGRFGKDYKIGDFTLSTAMVIA